MSRQENSAFSSEQQSGSKQSILAACYPPATWGVCNWFPLWRDRAKISSDDELCACSQMYHDRDGKPLVSKYYSGLYSPWSGYSSVLFYSHVCCWLYYMGLLTYGTHLFYPNNSLYMCDWLQNSTDYQCIWQLLHKSASVCSMVKPAG